MQLRKTGQARILARSCQAVSHWWPAAEICIVWPTPLCSIFLSKIIIWTRFWGVEPCTLEFVDSLFSITSCTKPIQAFVFPAWPFMASIWVWHLWDSGQTDPEPRMSDNYSKVPFDFWTSGDLFAVPYLCSLAYMGREESLDLYLQMCGMWPLRKN